LGGDNIFRNFDGMPSTKLDLPDFPYSYDHSDITKAMGDKELLSFYKAHKLNVKQAFRYFVKGSPNVCHWGVKLSEMQYERLKGKATSELPPFTPIPSEVDILVTQLGVPRESLLRFHANLCLLAKNRWDKFQFAHFFASYHSQTFIIFEEDRVVLAYLPSSARPMIITYLENDVYTVLPNCKQFAKVVTSDHGDKLEEQKADNVPEEESKTSNSPINLSPSAPTSKAE